ncbi:MAG: signal peptidase II [Deltaproteobacteria bacterium]|nr:signal peptidase II [Deltaproteobacteria bacterium]
MISIRNVVLVMTLLLASDQISKIWVRLAIPLHKSSNLIPNLIDLTHVENKGVSFSFLGNLNDSYRAPLLVMISLVAVIMLSYYWWKHRREMCFWTELTFLLVLPGAFGNLIDRALFGSVTDFFHFRFYHHSFFVNNLADIYISFGVVSYLIGAWRTHQEEAARQP